MAGTGASSPHLARSGPVDGGSGTAALVAAAMLVMNVLTYGFTLVAARLLAPDDFGALTALLGIFLVAGVASLGIQSSAARRIATYPDRRDQVVASVNRAAIYLAGLTSTAVVASTLVLTPLLKLDSHWPVVLCGLALFPFTVLGAQLGIAQGEREWRSVAVLYSTFGVGRIVFGTLGLALAGDATGAMLGIMAGTVVPALIGLPLLRSDARPEAGRNLMREVVLGSQALGGYFLLCSLDSLIARRFEPHESGLYAAGLILSKAALYLPQFVSVVAFADLAGQQGRTALTRAVGMVAGLGSLAVVATALFPGLALEVVGGSAYAEVEPHLWLFALEGAVLALVNLLVYDALARHAHGITTLVWIAAASVVVVATVVSVDRVGLVVLVTVVGALLAVALWIASSISTSTATATT